MLDDRRMLQALQSGISKARRNAVMATLLGMAGAFAAQAQPVASAEQLARKAVENMPPLPPTPTGKPLIFEKTISFTPFASDGPPSYKDDCLPDPPVFRNPFAWDGKSPQVRSEPPKAEKLDPQAMEECLRQLPKDSVEAEMARDRREMERWGWNK